MVKVSRKLVALVPRKVIKPGGRSKRPRPKRANRNSGMFKMVSAPAAFGINTRGFGPSSMRNKIIERGSELLTILKVTSGSSASAGQVLYSYLLNPTLMVQTRLSKFSSVYGQYRFISLSLEYIPASPTSADGNIVVALDKDVGRNLNTDPLVALSYAMDLESSVTGSIFLPKIVHADCKVRDGRQLSYFTDPTQSLAQSTQFRALVLQGITNTTITGGYSFMLRVHYTVEFSNSENVLPPVTGSILKAASGCSLAIDASTGVFTFSGAGAPTLPSTIVNNGLVYSVNPQICFGLEAGAPCIGSVINTTNSAGAEPQFVGFRDYETTQAQTKLNLGVAGVQGNAVTTPLPADLYFVPIGQSSIGYHP